MTCNDKKRDEIIENNFSYHTPSREQKFQYEWIREAGKRLAYRIELDVPESKEKTLAMAKLEECVMWANAGVARNTSEVK